MKSTKPFTDNVDYRLSSYRLKTTSAVKFSLKVHMLLSKKCPLLLVGVVAALQFDNCCGHVLTHSLTD